MKDDSSKKPSSESDWEEEEPNDNDNQLAPATKMAPWPLRYFQEMAEGFDEMQNMLGTLSQRFELAFPMAPYKKATWNKHWQLFKLAMKEELTTYLKPDSLWRKFTVAVHA
jgi:hypothetical protein